MARLVIRFDTSEPVRTMARVASRLPRAAARALNRSATTARAYLVREVAKDIGLKSSDVRAEMKIRNATPANLSAEVSVSGRRIPLIKFNARGPIAIAGSGAFRRRGGVTAKLPPPGKGRYPHAFIAHLASGHRGVFQRVGRRRLPIRELHGPSLPLVFEKKLPEAMRVGEEALVKNLQHEVNFLLGQTGG